MVVRGQLLDDAQARVGIVVEEGTADYAIVIAVSAGPDKYPLYGVRNKTTHVDEYQTSQLATARIVMREFQKDMTEGYDRVPDITPGSAPLGGSSLAPFGRKN